MSVNPSVMLVEDDADHADLFRRCLEAINVPGLSLVHCRDLDQAQRELARPDVKVIFLDYRIGIDTGLEFLRQMREAQDHRPVVVLTGQGNEYVAADMTRAGADDYIVKSDLEPMILEQVLRQAMDKVEKALKVQSQYAQAVNHLQQLTPREREVLNLIVEGKTNRQISQILHRSENTIKIHRSRIMRKMQANTAADLVRKVLSAEPPSAPIQTTPE